MVFKKPKVVKKPLMTVWCLDEAETQDLLEEKEKTSGFLSSGRKANLSELELDDILEEELQTNNVVEQSTESFINSEITLENEFVQFSDVAAEEFNTNILETEFEETGESQTSPIITLGLAATPRNKRLSRPSLLKVRRRDSPPVLDSRIGLPNINYLRLRDNNFKTDTNLIGPVRPPFLRVNQNMFQTRF